MDFPININSKLPGAGTNIFSVMSALANEHNAYNLAQGFPDFESYPELMDLVGFYMKKGHNQYAPMPGILPLRKVISEKVEKLYSAQYDPETEVTIVPGATLGIYAAITAVVRENDEVIVIEPAYDCYVPAIQLNGGKAVFSQMKYPGYKVDWDEVKKLINFRTRLIIINTPHNPTGSILTAADMKKLEKLVEDTDIIVLSDEVYEHILFEGVEHQSVARYPNLAARSMIISSFGKTYHTTGWKLGYILAPAKLTTEIRRVYQFMAFSANTPIQYAYTDFMQNSDLYNSLGSFYESKRNLFKSALKGSRFKILDCAGTYFQLLSYEKIGKEDDLKLAERLTIEHGVASIPISVFYHDKINNNVLRFCFAKKEETLLKAAENLCKI